MRRKRNITATRQFTCHTKRRTPCNVRSFNQCDLSVSGELLFDASSSITNSRQDSQQETMPNPSRVYVTGISMGGYGTWYASALRSDLFAASIPICGGGDIDWAGRFGDLPFWVFHGTDDNVVPINRSREMVAAMKRNGHRPEPKFTEYEGGAHDVWTRTYKRDDVFEWLFSQRK